MAFKKISLPLYHHIYKNRKCSHFLVFSSRIYLAHSQYYPLQSPLPNGELTFSLPAIAHNGRENCSSLSKFILSSVHICLNYLHLDEAYVYNAHMYTSQHMYTESISFCFSIMDVLQYGMYCLVHLSLNLFKYLPLNIKGCSSRTSRLTKRKI